MPNITVRAAATGLPNSRRAVLRSIFAAGAVATVPAAGAIASVGHPDAALFALQADIEAADRLQSAAFDVRNACERACLAVLPPPPPKPEGAKFTDEEWFGTFVKKMTELNSSPSPLGAAYDAAIEAWVQEKERLDDEAGLTAAEERVAEAQREGDDIRDQIVATRATTLAGLKFKAKYAVDHYPGEFDQDVMASIVDDLLAMEG
jgi:hypothetical protein